MRHYRRAIAILTCLGMLTALGCAGGNSKQRVYGTVSYKGKPVAMGTISFEPTDTKVGTASGGDITDGKYDIPAAQGLLPGEYKVIISSPDEKQREDPVPGESGPPAKELIPAKYNSESELKKEVKAGANEINFDLK